MIIVLKNYLFLNVITKQKHQDFQRFLKKDHHISMKNLAEVSFKYLKYES